MDRPAGIAELRARHRTVASLDYEPARLDKGYTRKWLRIDIGTGDIRIGDISQEMIDVFVGGKGFDLRLMWNEVGPETRWDSPQNPICISSGPLGGTTSYSGSGKALVTSISPTTCAPMDSNVGGFFGPFLKFCGFDALVVTGRSDEERIAVIDGAAGRIAVETAPGEATDSHVLAEQLTEMYASSPNDRDNVACVSAGRGSEHVLIGCLNFSYFDWRRNGVRLKQAGRGGIGTVMRGKRIKALVAHPAPWRPKWKIVINS